MIGARVSGLSRRAKYGLIHTDRGRTMVFHLGMSGRWRIDPEALGKHDHLLIETGHGHTLALNDARRFGSVDLVETDALEQWGPFAALGPEPLGPGLTRAIWLMPSRGALRRSSCCCSISGSWPALAISMSARRSTARASPHPRGARSACPRSGGWCRDPRGSGRSHCGGRLDLARLCPARWRTGLFRQGLARLWPRGGALRMRNTGRADGAGRPLDILLPKCQKQ
jgi:hypothetical protein